MTNVRGENVGDLILSLSDCLSVQFTHHPPKSFKPRFLRYICVSQHLHIAATPTAIWLSPDCFS